MIQDFVRKAAMVMLLLPIIWLGSCAIFAGGTAVAVTQVAKSELAEKAVKSHVEHARRDRNDEWSRDSTDRDYDHDYGETRDYDYD